MKPVASGCEILPDGSWLNDDVARLVAATGQQDLDLMNPTAFAAGIAAYRCARGRGGDFAGAYCQPLPAAGGTGRYRAGGGCGWLAGPLADGVYMEDMARALQLPVILVVGMRLGCINHALLTVGPFRRPA
jgi:dethiobiotin synthetase